MAIKIQEKSIDQNSLIEEFEKEYSRYGIELSETPLGSIGYTITFSGSLFKNLTEKELSLMIPKLKDVLSDLKKINKSKDLTEKMNSSDEDLKKILKKLPAKVQSIVMDLIAEIGDHPKFKDEAYFQDLAYNKMSDRGFSKKDISLATDALVKYYR